MSSAEIISLVNDLTISFLISRFALVFSLPDGEAENQNYNDKLALQRAMEDDDNEESGYISENDMKQVCCY